MLIGHENMALALSLDMIVIAGLVMAVYLPLQREEHPMAAVTRILETAAGRSRRPAARRGRGSGAAACSCWPRRLLPGPAGRLVLVHGLHRPPPGFSFERLRRACFTAEGFGSQPGCSRSGSAVATIVLVLLLTLPAMLAVRLSAPRLRPVMEVLCTLPLVVPPITFVAGIGTVLRWGPEYLAPTPFWATLIAVQDPAFPVVLVLAYVVLVLPFVYRSLDAGLRAMDVRTLVGGGPQPGGVVAARAVPGDRPQPALGPGQRLVPDARAGARRVHHGQAARLSSRSRCGS